MQDLTSDKQKLFEPVKKVECFSAKVIHVSQA